MKAKLQPFWYLVNSSERARLMRDYMREVMFQTYGTVGSFVAYALGKACLDGRVFCTPDKTSVELVAFKGAKKYRPSENCVKEETARRLALEKYWSSLPSRKTGWCLGHVFHQKFPPLQILSNCVADDIGGQCLAGARECRPGELNASQTQIVVQMLVYVVQHPLHPGMVVFKCRLHRLVLRGDTR